MPLANLKLGSAREERCHSGAGQTAIVETEEPGIETGLIRPSDNSWPGIVAEAETGAA
jgi:hypothetical protein